MIRQQLIYVTASFASGMIIMLAYDVLLIMRIIIRRPLVLTALEDVIFWLSSGIFAFYVFYRCSEGVIRIYAILAMLFGMWLFKWSVGDRAVLFAEKIIEKIRKCLKLLVSRCRMKISKKGNEC